MRPSKRQVRQSRREALDSAAIDLAAPMPTEELLVSQIREVDSDYWFDHGYTPTVRQVVEHCRLIADVDPAHPIVVDPDGRVMDGMHRVAHALLEGRQSVTAKRLPTLPKPDYVNCRPDDLPY